MADIQLRLEIWKPISSISRLCYHNRDENQGMNELERDRLHQQIYGWSLKEDPWTALKDDAIAIKDKFTCGFQFDLPPEQRSIKKLMAILDEFKDYFKTKENRHWQESPQPINENEDDSTFRVQPLLSLFHHLDWLCKIFKDVPGVSVTVR